jgi:hypothetical protein
VVGTNAATTANAATARTWFFILFLLALNLLGDSLGLRLRSSCADFRAIRGWRQCTGGDFTVNRR